MSFSVRFRAGEIDLELRGSESFVLRQLHLLSPYLGRVDRSVLDAARASVATATEPPPPEQADVVPASAPAGRPANGGGETGDELIDFFRSVPVRGPDRQADAALVFAYYLQRRLGRGSLGVGDLIRCCIQAGVDTRNFNRALGTLTRRGLLQAIREGRAYTLSGQGVAAVESRMP